MARYGNAFYQTSHYGANTSQLAGSAEPVYAVATNYSSVLVTWVEPIGANTEFIGLRLVRNQDAYAETEEDGVTVWSWYKTLPLSYLFNTDTVDIDPGADHVKVNNTLTTATELYISSVDIVGDISSYLEIVDDYPGPIKGHVIIQDSANPGDYVRYVITKNHYKDITYYEIPVTYVDGTVTSFANNQAVTVKFIRTGDESIATSVEDGVAYTKIALSPGRYVYYRMWLQKADGTWHEAGDSYTIVPTPHATIVPTGDSLSTLDKVVDLLPKVFTSTAGAPLDEADKTSPLYNFLSAFAFTLDEFLTLTALLVPDASGRGTNPGVLMVQADQLGLPSQNTSVSKAQKRTVREALFTYSRKGTSRALSTWVESLTGFAPTITVSPNMMLTNQDSTFNRSTGAWMPLGQCSITSDNSVMPPLTESQAIDLNYTGKVVVGTVGARLINGAASPKTAGIPVLPNTSYSFSYYVQSLIAASALTPRMYWYDFQGTLISSDSAAQTSGVSWGKNTLTAIAPSTARFLTLEFEFGSVDTYWLDMLQVAVSSQTAFSEARGVTVYLAPTTSIANPYPNKATKVERVIEELYNVLPNNTPYRLEMNNTDPVVGFTH